MGESPLGAAARRRLRPSTGFDESRRAALPKAIEDCEAPALPTIAQIRLRVRGEPGWSVVDIATGHDTVIGAPRALAGIVLTVCKT